MNEQNIQHPDITAAERTGYPVRLFQSPLVECSVCGCEMVLNSITREPVCEYCLEVIDRYKGDEPA